MDKLIKKISEIEEAASSVMDSMNDRKTAYAAEIKEKTADFDQQLEEATAKQLDELQKRMKAEMQEKLESQKAAGQKVLDGLEEIYQQNHAQLAASCFQQMIKE